MNKKQFEVLRYLEENQGDFCIKSISNELQLDGHEIKDIIDELIAEGAYINNKVTEKGYDMLLPYKVERIVIIAAGFGSRLVPLTYNTPKPLIRVHDVRMIDTMLDAFIDKGLTDITIVRGYLKEQFDVLLTKYPMLKFIDNDDYNVANNISSAILVKDMLEKAVVVEADLILSDPNIIKRYEYNTNYRCKDIDETDDWCFQVENDIVQSVSIGGTGGAEMIGYSYWSVEDARQLSIDLQKAYDMPNGKELFWDEVSLKVFKDNYEISVFRVPDGAITEIDTFAELCEIDPKYKVN